MRIAVALDDVSFYLSLSLEKLVNVMSRNFSPVLQQDCRPYWTDFNI